MRQSTAGWIDGSHENGFGIWRGRGGGNDDDDRLKDFGGFRRFLVSCHAARREEVSLLLRGCANERECDGSEERERESKVKGAKEDPFHACKRRG